MSPAQVVAPSPFRIRQAHAADVPFVVMLERGCDTAPHWPAGEYAAALDAAADPLRRLFLVAEAGGQVVGFAIGRALVLAGHTEAELESVAVARATRRRGMGEALCAAVMHWAAGQGARAMELEVRAQSAGAIALYRRLGFTPFGYRAAYYSDPLDDAVLMQASLDPGSLQRIIEPLW